MSYSKSYLCLCIIYCTLVSGVVWAEPNTKGTHRTDVKDTLPPVITVRDTLAPVISVKDKALTRAYKAAYAEVQMKLGQKSAKSMSQAKSIQTLVETIEQLMLKCSRCSKLLTLKKRLVR